MSFTQAADELNLTQSAVSRQVQNLEIFLKTPLFLRIRKRLQLTEEGMDYARVVQGQLDILEEESMKLITKNLGDGVLNLGTFTTFGSRWLIPKLSEFGQKYPNIQVNFITSNSPFDFTSQNIDIAVQHGDGEWAGLNAIPLMKEEVIAVCTPDLIQDSAAVTPQHVLEYNFLHLKTRQYAWPEWLGAQDVQYRGSLHGTQFETFDYMIRAAMSGLGVAIVPLMYVEEDLKAGRLVAPFGEKIESHRRYYLVTTEAKSHLQKVKAFSEWMLEQISI